MRVRVKLLGDVRRHLRDRAEPVDLDLPERANIADVLRALGIGEDEPLVVGVNGELGDRASALGGGDVVTLVTPMAGGA